MGAFWMMLQRFIQMKTEKWVFKQLGWTALPRGDENLRLPSEVPGFKDCLKVDL